jgi:hypothetical protein
MGRRTDSIGPVLPKTRVSDCDLLLIIEPVPIVRAKARIQDPLFKAKIALRKTMRDWVSLGGTRVAPRFGILATIPLRYCSTIRFV